MAWVRVISGYLMTKRSLAEDVKSDGGTTEEPVSEEHTEESVVEEPGAESDDDTEQELFLEQDTLVIFDWDDTILPSTWLEQQGLRLDDSIRLNDHQRSQLGSLTDCVIDTLSAAKRYGQVVFITNAEQGWVELSCQKFMPELAGLLADTKVVSARSVYEPQGVLSPCLWKHLAFEREILGFLQASCVETRKNIISIGDSPHERQALISVSELLNGCCIKALKFVEKPSLDLLLKEHEVIRGSMFHDIIHHDGCLDINMS